MGRRCEGVAGWVGEVGLGRYIQHVVSGCLGEGGFLISKFEIAGTLRTSARDCVSGITFSL